jgi:hypothetical protein
MLEDKQWNEQLANATEESMHEHLAGCGCGCGGTVGDGCCSFPPEFVRVRYYFGQRLGVMELADEASYHAGKMAFHCQRAHGVGVLCGLSAARAPFTPGAATTVLRVLRGAGLDGCGRELIVGVDQCIDLAAWAAKNKSRLGSWTAGSTETLVLAVRYRECPSDPSPAPRDPCGCEDNGCEFARIREGFELALFTPDEAADAVVTTQFPDHDALLEALESAPSGDLDAAIHSLVGASCPDAPDSGHDWLALASFGVVLDASTVPSDLTDPDNTIAERRSLLSTQALQSLLVELTGAARASGAIGGGPSIGALSFTAATATSGAFLIDVALVSAGTPPVASPIVAGTFTAAAGAMKLESLDAGGWTDVPVTATYSASPSQIKVDVAAGLAAGPRFRLSFDPPFATPVADDQGRALLPQRYAHLLAFVPDGALIKLDPAVQEN